MSLREIAMGREAAVIPPLPPTGKHRAVPLRCGYEVVRVRRNAA